MSDSLRARRAERRVNPAMGDVGAMVEAGLMDPDPTPPTVPPSPPGMPSPEAGEQSASLNAALLEAGVAPSPSDKAAVTVLSSLDPGTVDAIERWLKAKKQPGKDGPVDRTGSVTT